MTGHAEIRAAINAATNGPWTVGIYGTVNAGHGPDGMMRRVVTDTYGDGYAGPATQPADVHLIANAPTWLAELLAECERLGFVMDVRWMRMERLWAMNDDLRTERGQARADLAAANARLAALQDSAEDALAAQVRAVVALLGSDHITPIGRRQIERVLDEHAK